MPLHREMVLELVSGAGFSCKLMCGAGPVDLGGVPGVGFGRKSRAENIQPDCLPVRSTKPIAEAVTDRVD